MRLAVVLAVLALSSPAALAQGSWSWIQEARLFASDTAAEDLLGFSVSLSGATALVSAHTDDDSGRDSGSVHVFVRTGTTWSQQAKLTASDGAREDCFGGSVSLCGDTALVGATGNDDAGASSGSAYVFVRTGTVWSQQAKLTANDAATEDVFGIAVSLLGDTALIGAARNDDGGYDSGSAYVFTRTGTTWQQRAKLLASDAESGDWFGESVSLSGDTALVGASLSDDPGSYTGSAYVFTRSGTAWSQQAKLMADDASWYSFFGCSVSLSGDTALIGADEEDHAGLRAGAAYVFVRTGTVWTQQAKLTADDAHSLHYFGTSVSLVDDTALIGAWGDDDLAENAGAVYAFTRLGTNWTQQYELTAGDGEEMDAFGWSVSLSGDLALIGAWGNDDLGYNAGSAYVFERSCPVATCSWYCGTGANAATDGFVITSPPVLGSTFGVSVTGCAPSSIGAFLVAYSAPLTVSSDWGEVLVDFTDPNGELLGGPLAFGNPALIDLPVPGDPQSCGLAFYTQAASFGGLVCLHCAHACTIGG